MVKIQSHVIKTTTLNPVTRSERLLNFDNCKVIKSKAMLHTVVVCVSWQHSRLHSIRWLSPRRIFRTLKAD